MDKLSEPDKRAFSDLPEIRYVKGIGPKRAEIFKTLGVHSVRDLLYFFPRRYEDRSRFTSIASAPPGEPVTCRGEILEVRFRPIRRMPLVEVLFGDASGTLRAVFFNQPYLKKTFEAGQHVIFHGKVENYEGRLQITNPEFEIVEEGDEDSAHVGRIVPVYPLTEGLFQRSLRVVLKDAVEIHLLRAVTDPLPPSLRSELDLVPLDRAVQNMHFPASFEDLAAARKRIVFDEFFDFFLRLMIRMKKLRTRLKAPRITAGPERFGEFRSTLPFPLTSSQEKALADIARDLATEIPMNRLLQGDVGSGKTVVAVLGMAMVVESGAQAAIMAPTSILAEQHYQTISKLLTEESNAVPPYLERGQVRLLTGDTGAAERGEIFAGLESGYVKVLIGTHALIEDPVVFQNLQMAVVDEQHRFGVAQRAALRNKGDNPHLLVMTATPIPRSLQFTIFGDLDVSIMDELPAGRIPILTYINYPMERERVYEKIRMEVENGNQAFIIYPLVEAGENDDAKAAVDEQSRLQREVFPEFKVGLVHGRMRPAEKDQVMLAFRNREFDVLVSTSVVEVGVDIPNATVMVIEGANHFGLSQLHQFRGRVGRGSEQSYCFLIPDRDDAFENKRLKVMTETNDGFVLAEEDLKQRGPGDFLGTRQAGALNLQVASLADTRLIKQAREIAEKVLLEDPDLNNGENLTLKDALETFWPQTDGAGDVS